MGHNCVLWLAVLTIFFGNACSFTLPADFPEKECKPGETKQVDCNSCWCTPDGFWGCTRLGCITRQKQDTEKECKPGETKQVDCNSCWCTPDGFWGCTRLGCITRQKQDTETICSDFETKWDGNNHCTCVNNEWNCRDVGGPCKAGETKMQDCNHCWCGESGLWACTLKGCLTDNRRVVREKRDTDEECTDEDIKWDGNNHCVCHDKKWSCHDVGGPCKAGETKMQDCNHCWCGESGLWACTLKGCLTDNRRVVREKRDTDEECTDEDTKWDGNNYCVCHDKKWSCYDVGGPCKPGERKMKDCNECDCNHKGLWYCTLIGCEDDFFATRQERSADSVCTEDSVKYEGNMFCKCKDNKWECQINEFAEPCKPGESKSADCNGCWCTDDGTWACTIKFCPPIPKNESQRQEEETAQSNKAIREKRNTEPVCTEDTVKFEGDQFCKCKDNKWDCQINEFAQPCKPGERKSADCNGCWCTDDGTWACTIKFCPPIPKNESQRQEEETTTREKRNSDECTDMKTKWEGNNYCICHDKKWSCQDVGGPCKPGETKMEDCNHCFCTETGLWGCTLMGCSKYNLAIREERSADQECTDEERKWEGISYCACIDKKWHCENIGGECEPGEGKQEDCNSCSCIPPGIWRCTLKGCLPHNHMIDEETIQSTQTIREKRNADDECTDMKTKWEGNNYCICHDKKWRCEDVGGPCKPGETKMEDCNHCFCTETGLWGCTLMGCSKFNLAIREERSTECTPGDRKSMDNDTVRCVCMSGEWRCLKHETGESCTPLQKKTSGCYTCWCSLQGTWECSMDLCVGNFLAGCARDQRAWLNNDTVHCICMSGEWVCSEVVDGRCRQPGAYKRDECNDCFCTDVGLWGCTTRKCVPDYKGDGSCTPGDKRWTGSEYCYCGLDEKWECEDVGGPCKYKETKMEECNRCICEADGFWKCERKDCTRETEKGCTEYENKLMNYDTENCTCIGGEWLCSKAECRPYEWKWLENDTVHCICLHGNWACGGVSLPRCTTGDYMRDECDDCFCNYDEAWICTRRKCVPDYKEGASCNTTGEARWSGPDYSEYCYCTSEHQWKCEDLGGPCRYNETKMENCNLCKCDEHGLWVCEDKECKKEVAKREADDYCLNNRTKFDGNQYCKCVSHKWKCQEIGRPCPTDNKKWEVCNRANNCTCLDLGVESCHRTKNCTHAVLKKQEEEEKCSPLSPPKKEGCNYCFCTSRGLWVCTQNECGQLSKRSAVVPVATDLINTPCAPDDYFKVDCNTCYCNIERTGYLCTQNICPPPSSATTVSGNDTNPVSTATSSSINGTTEESLGILLENVTYTSAVPSAATSSNVNGKTEESLGILLENGRNSSIAPSEVQRRAGILVENGRNSSLKVQRGGQLAPAAGTKLPEGIESSQSSTNSTETKSENFSGKNVSTETSIEASTATASGDSIRTTL